jgi:hypothetical protein
MPVSLARKMTHNTIFLPRNESLYHRMNRFIYEIISSQSPVSEPAEIGQYYLDMSGMKTFNNSARQRGYNILKEIKRKSNLSAALAIGSNKLITRISTLTVPEALYEVPRGEEAEFVAPLYSKILPCTAERRIQKIIEFLFLNQVKDLQKITRNKETSALLFGNLFQKVSDESMGLDRSPVSPPKEVPAITRQKILSEDTNDTEILEPIVQSLAAQIGFELRQRGQSASNIAVEIHYSDGYKNIRRGKNTANKDLPLSRLCLRLFEQANYRRSRIRSVIIHADKLHPYSNQLNLFTEDRPIYDNLQKAVDHIRVRFGQNSIQYAAMLNN